MQINATQRWTSGRASYRPAGETIQTSAYEVAEITQDSVAKAFVTRHHYSGSYPAAGTGTGCTGVRTWSPPAPPGVPHLPQAPRGVGCGFFLNRHTGVVESFSAC